MGIGLWIVAGIGAFLLARLVRGPRPRWWVDALTALVGSLLAGLTATALDFGGWKEPDWRAGTFAFLVTLTLLALTKLVSGLEKQLFTKTRR